METKTKLRQEIGKFLPTIRSATEIYNLFELLNYPKGMIFNETFKRKIDEFEFKAEDRSKIKNIYTVLSIEKSLNVFLVETTTLSSSLIRYIAKIFSDKYENFLLIITKDFYNLLFVFPEFEKVGDKHKLKITKLFFERDEPYYTGVEILSNLFYEGTEKSWRDIRRKWKEAFNVERITEKFFGDYTNIFFRLRDELIKQKLTKQQAHEFTLQFLNRIMFIYFVSKKRWLNNDTRFLRSYWRRYLSERNQSNMKKDSFYEDWLKVLFFKAFNDKQSEIRELPKDLKEMFFDFPYLNGGLFTENNLDGLKVLIGDSLIKEIFSFFEKYNFTIKEEMPLELEVAVDPQMIGYVYESLANVAEEIYDRTDLGIFYTPRVEVDFMCRRSLVEYLAKHLLDVPKEKIYEFVFDDDKEKVEKYFTKLNLWHQLEDVLDNLSVVDPACGSGGFLVGMMNVLYELYRIIYKNLKRTLKPFDFKSSIVGRSLYGVDVMSWAVHAAELRLWLQLIIETEFSKEELKKRALLPNLNLNLRVGDSLVQEIGGVSLNLRSRDLSDKIKRELLSLKEAKERYFYNVPTKFQRKEEFLEEEIRIFQETIDKRIEVLEDNLSKLQKELKNLEKGTQTDLSGKRIKAPEKEIKKVAEELEKVKSRLENLHELKNNLKDALKYPEKKPFVWEIDFAEIFGDKGGFDIVIGNPPYVRQEKISPPNKIKAEVTLEDRREYKEKLIQSVKMKFPMVQNLDKKSDYYIYFYFHGLRLLNKDGIFTFITSNSWLDVGYGKELQEFLCKYVPIITIYDNPKRSFAHADINTIIALFGAPVIKEETMHGLRIQGNNNWPMLQHTAKFVMFKKPFEEVLSAKNMIEIENAKAGIKGKGITEIVKNVLKTDDFRAFPIIQEDLLNDGWEYPEEYDGNKGRFKTGNYEGNKWGGKYLRAPDIFYTILEKGGDKFVPLKKFGIIKRGITTGINEFFYLNTNRLKEFKIEKRFIKLALVSPRYCESINIDKNKIKHYVFLCDKRKSELKGTKALKYIEWGESQKYHKKPTLANVKNWYSLRENPASDIILYKHIGDKEYPLKNCGLFVNNVFYEIVLNDKKDTHSLLSFLGSSFIFLFEELQGQVGLGLGALVLKVPDWKVCPIFKVNYDNVKFFDREIKPIFEELGINPDNPIREQEPKPLPDRAELDKIVFDELGLTKEERKEVYWAVCELVKERLEKARSLEK